MKSIEKNIAKGTISEEIVEQEVFVLKMRNDTSEAQKYSREVDSTYIQFHFCLRGRCDFLFNQGSYAFKVQQERCILLYNPTQELPMDVQLDPSTWVVSLLIPIRKFHALFSEEADHIHFLGEENRGKKYYDEGAITPAIAVVLSQIMSIGVLPSLRKLYLRGKVYELLGLYFNRNGETDIEQCPFLVDEEEVRRIRVAKDIIITRMTEPPTLQELAEEIGLNIRKLKEGFREVYGDSVYGFLFDYKMEYARKMLATGKYNVNEVGHKVGYSTASHFIAAFKKKYGTTPKKYLMSLSSS